tara:strand:- start:24378 stop:25106 length:729 start_codon:yes stop_codon:yes gene_type:complete
MRRKTIKIILTLGMLILLSAFASASIIKGFQQMRFTDLMINGSSSLDLFVNDASALYITTIGNVGINTTTPSERLVVSGNLSVNDSDTGASALFVDSTSALVGIGTPTPGSPLHVIGNVTVEGGNITLEGKDVRMQIDHDAAGYNIIKPGMAGVDLIFGKSGTVNAANRYTPAIKFMNKDDVTTNPPKLLAAIAGRATEGYSGDTKGGMALDFATTQDTPGAGSNPIVRMTIQMLPIGLKQV